MVSIFESFAEFFMNISKMCSFHSSCDSFAVLISTIKKNRIRTRKGLSCDHNLVDQDGKNGSHRKRGNKEKLKSSHMRGRVTQWEC